MNQAAQKQWNKEFVEMLDRIHGKSSDICYSVLKSLADKGNWRAQHKIWIPQEHEKLLSRALTSKYRTPFLDEIKNEFFILRLKGEI